VQDSSGDHYWLTGGTDAADSAISWSTRMIIKNNGAVGIGTTTPQFSLEVDGAASALNAHFGQGQNNGSGVFGGISLGYAEANTSYRKVGIVAKALGDNAARQNLHFLVDTVSDAGSAGLADTKMMIDGLNGNVGIGTTSPDHTLVVQASANTNANILAIKDSDGTRQMTVEQDSSGNGRLFVWNTSDANKVLLHTNGNSYLNGGNVGIGLTNPDSKLYVKDGHIKVEGNATDTVFFEGVKTGTGVTTKIYNNSNGTYWDSYAHSVFRANQLGGSGGSIVFMVPNEAMRISSNSSVGIGTTSPAAKLHINGTGDLIRATSTNTGAAGAQVDLLHFTTSPADEDTFAVINAGGYYTGTTSVYGTQIKNIWTDVSERHSRFEFYTCDTSLSKALTIDHLNTITAVGDVVAYSDKKLKKNIKTLDGSKVYNMRGVSFDRVDTDKPSSGVIAQEIQKIAPELVNETDGTLGVAYGNLTGYLIEAIKDLKAEIEELKKHSCDCKK
jgi:hypothetical protein